MEFIPTLNSSGTFLFKSPISDKINPQSIFVCKSIRKITELLSAGEDVLQKYYITNNLSNETYEEDLNKDASVIGLYSDSIGWLYVPSSQINGYPDNSGVPYRRLGLVVNLGPVVENYNLDSINNLLKEVVKTHLGIDPEVNVLSLSEQAMVKREDHEAIERMRLSKINTEQTVFVKLAKSEQTVIDLQFRLKQLEDYIISLNT
jgi:hypothetical protein